MTRPWETLDRVETKDGPLELKRRGTTDFLVTIRGRVLMTSAAHRSEDALARLGCAALVAARRPRVLLSGLGMGFTLRAALDVLPRGARVTVAELNEVVARWCRGPIAGLTAAALDDARVTLQIADVAKVIARAGDGPAAERFDAILLDMYEGPPSAAIAPRDPLYGARALGAARAAMSPGGVLAVWGEKPSPAFERGLRAAGFRPERHHGGRGALQHWVTLGHLQGAL